MLTGYGSGDSAVFVSPAHLPWEIEWLSEGTGPYTFVMTLMDADGNVEIVELVSDSGNGPLGGVVFIFGNMGTFYLRVEGPEAGWTIWVRN